MDLWLQYILAGAIVAGCGGWLLLRGWRFLSGKRAGGCHSCSGGGCGEAGGKPIVSAASLRGPKRS